MGVFGELIHLEAAARVQMMLRTISGLLYLAKGGDSHISGRSAKQVNSPFRRSVVLATR